MSADVRSEPTNKEIFEWVEKRYGTKFAEAVRKGLLDPASPGFAAAVRRSLIREMTAR